MIHHLESLPAHEWSPDDPGLERWSAAAESRLGDLAIFHHPGLAALGLRLDPDAGTLHRLEWDPGDGPALPFLLVESRNRFGPAPVPVLTTPTHRFFVYAAAFAAPGLLPACVAGGSAIGLPDQLHFFPHLPMSSAQAGAILEHAPDVQTVREDVCPRILVEAAWGGDWKRYWAARAHGLRSEVPRLTRRMQEQGPLEFHSSRSLTPAALQALERAMELHRERWASRVNAASDLSGSGPRERLLGLAGHFETVGALRLDWLEWQERVAAMILGLRAGATHFIYWITFDTSLGRFSPGSILHARVLEQAFADGCRQVDFLFGDAAYKKRWADDIPEVSTVLAGGPGPLGKAAFHAVRIARHLKLVLRRRP